MFQAIIDSVNSFGHFSEEEMSQFLGRLKQVTLKKGTRIMIEGQVCQTFFFVNRGRFRQYQLLDSGSETTLNLYLENDWVCEYRSFMTQTPSETVIQAEENSEIFELNIRDFHELVKISDAFFRIGRIFEQVMQNTDFKSSRISPEEKYQLLLATKPKVIQRFPLKVIASFLEITPETLSRVRRKIIS